MSHLGDLGTSPINYLKIFFRRKELLLIPAFLGLAIGIAAGVLLPKQYKSETIILVREGKTDNPLFNQLAVSTTIEQRLTGIRESILGWNSLVEVVKRLNLDKDVKTKRDFEDLILGLRGRIKIQLRGTNILNLTYVGEDPVRVQSVIKNITDVFIDKNVNMQNRETSEAITFIEEQLKVYRGKIKSAEIAEFQEQLDTLLVDSTEKHPLVQDLKAQIAAKKEELRKQNLEYTEDTAIVNQPTKPMIDEIKKALDTLEGKATTKVGTAETPGESKFLVNVDLEKVLARDVNVNEQIYNMLLQRLETAKITQRLQSSKEGTSYDIIDPPRVALRHFKPNKGIVALVGLFFGLAVGVGLILGFEFLDKSFIDVEEAKDYLGVALFGAISKINTPDSIRQEKERKRWLYGLTIVVCAVIVAAAYGVAGYMK